MADPWLTLIGLGEDGLDGLTVASRKAIAEAEIIFGGPRHLELVSAGERGREWPIPFSVSPVLAQRGRRVVVLASGDPFWFGAGGSLSNHLAQGEWFSIPAPSTFALAANRLGWKLEDTACLGLHAAPFSRLLPLLTPKRQIICLVRDGDAAMTLAKWLVDQSSGESALWVMEALGGPRERIRPTTPNAFDLTDILSPVVVAVQVTGGNGMSCAAGLPDEGFVHDGQITKRPIRAFTLSALAPRASEMLWDIGSGSGSISVEWCLLGGKAIAVEARENRAENIRTNAANFGVEHLLTTLNTKVIEGRLPEALLNGPGPDAVFVGGGGSADLFETLWKHLPKGTRLVVNGVTLETEALLVEWHNLKGGDLHRFEVSKATPLGTMRGWVSARPVVQWSVAL